MTMPLLQDEAPAPVPGERRGEDLYPTPLPVCRAIVRQLVALEILQDGARVLEPHVGLGTFVTALDQVATEMGHRYEVTVHDIQSSAPGLSLRGSLSRIRLRVLPPGDWLIAAKAFGPRTWDLGLGNPPFAKVAPGKTRGQVVAIDHVQATRAVCTWTSFVLRDGLWTASGAIDRVRWATQELPRYRLELAPRPSFTGDERNGQFGVTAAIWGPDRSLWTQTRVIDWRKAGAL